MSSSHPHQEQLIALATLVGALVAMVRRTGAISEDELQGVFVLARERLPDGASPAAAGLIGLAEESAKMPVPPDRF